MPAPRPLLWVKTSKRRAQFSRPSPSTEGRSCGGRETRAPPARAAGVSPADARAARRRRASGGARARLRWGVGLTTEADKLTSVCFIFLQVSVQSGNGACLPHATSDRTKSRVFSQTDSRVNRSSTQRRVGNLHRIFSTSANPRHVIATRRHSRVSLELDM